jgi:hypothetical protein
MGKSLQSPTLLFEKMMEILSKLFSTLDKDLDERYSECQKVEKLDMEVVAQKLVIASRNCITLCE